MTTATLARKIMKYEAHDGSLYKKIIVRLIPRPIENKKMHGIYSQVTTMLMEAVEEGVFARHSKEREDVETFIRSVAHFLQEYEKKEFPRGSVTPEDVLSFLMEQHDLTQNDIAEELGGQPAASMILNGKRKLNREQIERLSDRFHISPGVFFA